MDAKSTWDWHNVPDDDPPAYSEAVPVPESEPEPHPEPSAAANSTKPTATEQSRAEDGETTNQRDDPARECYICREQEAPKYVDTGYVDKLRGRRMKRTYVSDDPELGRLISPCMCKGDTRYVHEGCLKTWRASGNVGALKCGACKFEYKLERLTWAQYVRSPLLALLMTVGILILATFLLGFVADPILSLWLDPVGTIADTVAPSDYGFGDAGDFDLGNEDEGGWLEHFVKGIFSLGLLGFAKAFLAMSPWQWWNIRNSGIVGGPARRAHTGRERMENISLALVIFGVITFLWAVWKGTRSWTQRTLDRASERILNQQKDEEEFIYDLEDAQAAQDSRDSRAVSDHGGQGESRKDQ